MEHDVLLRPGVVADVAAAAPLEEGGETRDDSSVNRNVARVDQQHGTDRNRNDWVAEKNWRVKRVKRLV